MIENLTKLNTCAPPIAADSQDSSDRFMKLDAGPSAGDGGTSMSSFTVMASSSSSRHWFESTFSDVTVPSPIMPLASLSGRRGAAKDEAASFSEDGGIRNESHCHIVRFLLLVLSPVDVCGMWSTYDYISRCSRKVRQRTSAWYVLYVEATRHNLILPDLPDSEYNCISTVEVAWLQYASTYGGIFAQQ